jgi:hypothetical protein
MVPFEFWEWSLFLKFQGCDDWLLARPALYDCAGDHEDSGGSQMNLWTGIAMLAVALFLIRVGRPDKSGVHPRFLRFNAALVLYPPVILAFTAMGAAAVISSIWK